MSEFEEWREIDLDPRYLISSRGRVRGARGYVLKLTANRDGYLQVNIHGTRKVHQLVCAAFNGPRPTPAHGVAHANGVRSDNRADNLRWATQSENIHDAVEHGTLNVQRQRFPAESCGRAKLTWAQVDEIRARSAAGVSNQEMAEVYGVWRSTIRDIVRRTTWRDEHRPEIEEAS